jgi:SAM-dependent methyltransferase
MLIEAADALGRNRDEITVLDAGCARGELSVYLACLGFRVIGVDISAEGCAVGRRLAERLGVGENCTFLAESLEHMALEDNSVDFIIGQGTLHHFIKYGGVPAEFLRIMKDKAQGFFDDPFQENLLYRLFHDKKKMERLGDCLLTKRLVTRYFEEFELELLPTDWFVMFDKFLDRIFKLKGLIFRRRLSKVFFYLDRRIPSSSRLALLLSGSVITFIRKPSVPGCRG